MRKIRKPVSILLSLVMILSIFTIIPVSVQAAEVCTDTLTVDDTGATRTDYVSWTAQNSEDHPNISSDAVYAGDSAKGNDGIQMRSKSQSGIVSTGSGGKVRKVTVAWVDTYQNDDRELAVYGSNSAYSSAADLYTDGARGDLLDTFCYNDASYSEEESVYYNVLETADDYRYIGLRSRSGALYLASVTIDWEIPQAGHVWDWADDYSAATCTFTDESGSYTETASVTSEVTKEPTYIEEGVLTHTAVVTYDGVNYRDVQTEAIPRLEFAGSVPYIDENGIQQDSPAGTMLLTGAETELTSGWYAAASNITVDDIKVSGNVKIILCDGVTVKAASMSTFRVSGSNDKLTFYGQEDNSGAIGDVNSYCTVEGKGELTVNGGTFCKCGLRAGSSMTINGGKINDASGNVTLYCPNGTLTVNGGDVYCSAGNECVDCNSFVYNGGVFNGRSSFTGVYCRGESATFSWKYENDSVYFSQLGCWKLIDIMSNTSDFEGFSVTLLKDFVDKNGNKYPAGNYNSWDLRYTTLYPDVDKWQILQQRINDSQSGDVITLKSDYKASSDNTALVVPQEKGVLTIDLNGHTIDRGLSSKDAVADGNVITNHATELHIIDSSRSKSGRITGGNNTGDGGGIISDVNTLELNGVTVSGNKSAGNGGGIWSNSVVVLNDSTVKENRAGGSGGGIYCSINHHNNKINVSGSVNVTGNTKSDGTADNVYFSGSQNIIQVTGQLASGSRIGVGTSVQNQTITSGLNGKGTAANFTSDKKGYLVTLTSGGEAKLAKAYVIHFDPNGGSGEMDDIVTLDTTVTMPECTFTAPEGKRFKAWSDGYGNDSIQEDEEIGISSGIYEYTISAVWADIHTITVDQPEHGSIRANKSEAIEGERVRLTATPEEGYRLHHFTVTYGNGQTVNVNNNSYFFMPDADVTVSVTWAQEHTITVSCGSHGTASADKDIAVEGETVTVMFQPDEDYELDAIKVTDSEDSEIDVGDDHSFGMPDSDVIVTVSFKHAASEHTADKMTPHEAITPVYNSENGSYINGCVEYYVCPVCSGCFVEENGSFVKKTASELIVPYFRFRSVTSEGHQQCVILDYNGTDADVVIPEMVPAGYPDSSQIGNTVTGIDHNAFKDKTFVMNVTIGDGLNSICESAFEGCTGLRTVTIGSSLNRIGKDAFKGCSALESFTTTSTNSIQYQYSPGYGDESAGQFSFDPDTEVVFHAPHNSSLLYAAIDYDTAFSATDRHDEPTWNWSYDYSSATAIFNCERDCQMKFDEYPATVTQDGDHVSASVTIDGEIYTDVLSDLPEIETVSYIDEKGETKSVRAIVLTGNEQKEYHSYGIGTGYAYRIQLGKVNNNSPFDQTPEDSWYVVKDNVSYTESLNCYLELMGNVHIIVADGATLNVKSDITGDILSVYGQTGQTGRVTAGYVDCGTVNVCSGGLSVNGNVNCDKLAIYGGTTDITGAVDVDESLLLGCAGANDSITIGSPAKDSDASAAVVTGQVLTDGSREYSGELFDPDLSAMAGKTLVKVHEHNTANDYMTYHAAVAPTYNSAANTYTGGTVEHYDCSICGGHFVLEDNQLVSKTDEELVVLYFVFQGNPIPGYTDQCWVHEYNGTDADVIIPDTVPADYPVSSLRGKTVIAVDGKAFKDKSYITSITTGDALARIYSSAFKGCTSLETVTVGSGLDSIDTDAFKGCTALKSFISSSTEDITFSHNTDDPEHPQQSFDIGTEVVFRGPHDSSLLAIADYYDTTFSPTDRHVEPVWTWAADYCSATATFACSGCQLDGDEHPAAITLDGTVYTATVTVDGKDYTDTVDVAESAVAKIAPDHYFADFRSAIVAAHDTYDDAVIELLKDTSFTWDLELCKNYPSFKVKKNGHTLDDIKHSCYPVSITDDTADVVTYTAVADHKELTLRSVLNESDGEYSIIMFFLCGNCGERIDETTYEAEKHAAKAATCTETGNIEYYVISEELGSTVITYYYVLADSPEYENEVTCVDGDEIAAVTVPIDPDNHPMPLICHPEVEPTLTSDGNSAYYECSGCHKYFSDATGSIEISENSWILNKTAVAMIAPNHYYADFRSAIVAAHDDYNDAIIELLKDTTLSWDPELCQDYTPFRVKMNGHSIDSISQPHCYAICSTDDTAEIITYSVESYHDVDLDNIYCILEEEAGNYITATHMICPICGFDTVLRNDVVKHAAKAATCTETGNIEYYSIFVENGNYPFTNYYVLKAPDQADHENELELLGSDVADVTIPIDPDAHQLTYHPAVEPTFTTEGNIAYWTCDICGNYFSDENGEHEITQAQTVVSSTAVAMIAPDHYYTDFRSAIVAAHDDYNDAIIELLKDTTLSWDPELCQDYTPFRVKMNGHSIDSISQPPCYAICSTDDTAEIITYSVESYHDVDLDNIYCILEEEASNYTAAVHMICPICGFDTVLRNDVVKHAAKAATCTETGNIEYYSIFVENGNYPFTRYFVLKDPAQAEHENELEFLGTDVADVTIPIDPDAHQIINDPEWSWTGSDSEGYTSATATFTCSRCSATETVTDTAVTSKTNDGSITYTATVEFEGKTYTTSKQVFDDGIGVHLAGHSISLDGDIAVNFYMEIAPEVISHEGVYMQFTVPKTSKEYQNQKVYIKDLDPVEVGDKTYYVFKCKVAAKDMNSEISAQLIDGDKTSTVYKYSVKEYADYLIEHQDDNQTFKEAVPLVEAMLKYGTYANNYFSDADALEALDVDIPAKEASVTALPEGVEFDGATLSLKSQTTLSLYFVSEQEITLSMNGKTEGKDYELAHNGNEYVIRIRNISAAELNDDFTVTVTSNGQSGTVTYSPLTYCYKAQQTSTNSKLVNTVKALYNYHREATNYFEPQAGGGE